MIRPLGTSTSGGARIRVTRPSKSIRFLKDELPTPAGKNQIWKDGIANIDEHLNGWAQGASSIYARDVKKHVWAMNETQRFFIEETRLGIRFYKCGLTPIFVAEI